MNDAFGTNQAGAFEARELPVQRNKYPQWMYSQQIGAEFFVGDRVSLQSGLGITRYSQEAITITGAQEDNLGFVRLTTGVDPATLDEAALTQSIGANRLEHTALDIPLDVNVYAGNARRSLAFSAGMSYHPVVKSSTQMLKRAEYDLASTVPNQRIQEATTENILLNPYALTSRLGLRLQQRIGKNVSLYGGPSVSYALAPAYASLSGIDQSRMGLGLEMGVKWQHAP